MADPVYDANLLAETRRSDKLEIRVDPGNATPTTYARVPVLSDFTPFQPNVTVNRKPLYNDADGSDRSLVAVTEDGGTLEFRTAAPAGNAMVRTLFANRNKMVMFKATYADGLVEQGQAVLVYLGRQGGTTDVPEYGWRLEAVYGDPVLPA